jgi:hypothetical protein
MMNSGAPITGSERRPLNKAGIDMLQKSFFRAAGNAFRSKTISAQRCQTSSHQSNAQNRAYWQSAVVT